MDETVRSHHRAHYWACAVARKTKIDLGKVCHKRTERLLSPDSVQLELLYVQVKTQCCCASGRKRYLMSEMVLHSGRSFIRSAKKPTMECQPKRLYHTMNCGYT